MAHDAFEVPDAAAGAEALVRIERHDRVSALPDSLRYGIEAESDSVAERPGAHELIELSMSRRDAGSDDIGVVECRDRREDSSRGERFLHCRDDLESFELVEIWGILDYAVADDSWKRESDDVDRLSFGERFDFVGLHANQIVGGHRADLIGTTAVGGKSRDGARDVIFIHHAERDVFTDHDSDASRHGISLESGE